MSRVNVAHPTHELLRSASSSDSVPDGESLDRESFTEASMLGQDTT